jgi:hypothetical protein
VPTWKVILLRAAGFGAAFALVLCLIGGGLYWYSTRPRPWNKDAMKATFSGFSYQAKTDMFVLTLEYSIDNTTNRDYTLPADTTIFEKMSYDKSYGQTVNAQIVGERFIPAKHEINIKVEVTYQYNDLGTTFQEVVTPEKRTEEFALKRLNRIDGLELFDRDNRYQIDLPATWTSWDPVKNAFADEEKTQEVKTKAQTH